MIIQRRDNEILKCVEQSIMSMSQIAVLYFPSRKKASERLTMLFRAGFVSRFCKPFIEEQGRPEYIYCKKGRRQRSYGWIKHQLLTTDFRIWLINNLPKEFSLEFIYPSQLSRNFFGGLFMPDACFIIKQGEKQLLYLLEIDQGTEAISGKSYAFKDKVALYEDYFDKQLYQQDFPQYPFRGFRVFCVFNSAQRMKSFTNTDTFFICATWDETDNWGIKLGIKLSNISPTKKANTTKSRRVTKKWKEALNGTNVRMCK